MFAGTALLMGTEAGWEEVRAGQLGARRVAQGSREAGRQSWQRGSCRGPPLWS